MQYRRGVAVVAAAIVLASGAGAGSAQPLVVRIGHVAATSGWLARVGMESENGARMAIEQRNAAGTRIGGELVRFELVAADDAADSQKGLAVARELVAAQVSGVVGHFTSGSTIAAAKTYAEAGIPQISPTSTSSTYTRQGYRTAFRVIADDTQIGRLLGVYAVQELKAVRFAVIDDGSAYGQGLSAEFSKAVMAGGGRIVAELHTGEQTTDFTASLAALQTQRPDVVFFGGMDRQAGPMIEQMRQLGIDARFLGGDGLCSPDLASYWAAGAAQDDQVVCAHAGGMNRSDDPAMATFRADYARRFGAEVEFYAAYAYDAAQVLIEAMVRANSADPARYLPALAATRNYPGLTGAISFDEKGDVRNPSLSLFTYRGGARIWLRDQR